LRAEPGRAADLWKEAEALAEGAIPIVIQQQTRAFDCRVALAETGQALLRGGGALPATWGRVFAENSEIKWDGDVAPSLDGDLSGFQIGQDFAGFGEDGGTNVRLGAFVGRSSTDGSVRGGALGWNDLTVGQIDVKATSLAGYATLVGENGWYVDTVVMHSWFDGETSASSGEAIDIETGSQSGAEIFDAIDSVDSLRVAEALERALAQSDKRMPVLIQVKINERETQSGAAPEELTSLLKGIEAFEHLQARGLMGIAPATDAPEQARPHFQRLRKLFEQNFSHMPEGQLSMGMSTDFEVAVEEGSTMVRIGSAVFS